MNTKFYGEGDLDKILREKYFSDYSYKGTIIEVGGATPEFLSMSRHFKNNGWRAIIIEPNPNFCKLHRECGNELYEFACSNKDADNVDFTIIHVNSNQVTDHSSSSLGIKDSYRLISNNWVENLPKTTIKVNVRTLDSIINTANITQIDILSIDTEGWEIEVMEGFSAIKSKIVVLENIWSDTFYRDYMKKRGYDFESHISGNDIYRHK